VAESSRSIEEPLARALPLAREALKAAPAGLLTDFDGTLSPIVTDPALARIVDGADGALTRLTERLAVVAIVTGRAPFDARAMTGVPGLLVAGNHGTEWLEPHAVETHADVDAEAIRARLDAVLARLPHLDGVPIEHKGISASVHYRNAADAAAARAVILASLGDVAPLGIELRHGRMSVELRAAGVGDKGSAARAIVERFGLRGVVVMGDDVTDLDMFRAVAELRASGRVRAAIVGVGGEGGEVPAEVAEAADVLLADPAEAAALLDALADG
jgi:trehalose 6-phosphate phosphatase